MCIALTTVSSLSHFLDCVEDGTIQITDEDFPSFLYETDRIYDEENEDLGLFRGFLLARVYRHIFTGPLSAINPNTKSNKSKAKKFKLMSVTGRTIAYACVQVCDFHLIFSVRILLTY